MMVKMAVIMVVMMAVIMVEVLATSAALCEAVVIDACIVTCV